MRDEKKNGLDIGLQTGTIIKFLLVIEVILIFSDLFFGFFHYVFENQYSLRLYHLFQLSAESSAGNLYSGATFFISSLLLIIVWIYRKKSGKRQVIWLLLACLFLFLSFDEFLRIYDIIIRPIRKMYGYSFRAWIISVGALLGFLAVRFYPIWRGLNTVIKKWMVISATTFLSGSILFEMMGHYFLRHFGGKTDVIYNLLDVIEESLELAGTIAFIYSLLLLIQLEFNGIRFIIIDKLNRENIE